MAVFIVVGGDRQRELLQVSDILHARRRHADFLHLETDHNAQDGDDRKNDQPARMSDQELSDVTHVTKNQINSAIGADLEKLTALNWPRTTLRLRHLQIPPSI